MRRLVSFALGLAVSGVTLHASALTAGIVGQSGKTAGATCANAGCHNGGAAPAVTITGPATLEAGKQGDFTLEITTALAKGSAGIAASDGATLVAGTGLQANGKELTHTSGGTASAGGKVTFTFKVTAPASGTTMTIFAAGLGSDGTAGAAGDGTKTATKEVAVTGGSAAPPPATGDDDDDKPKTDDAPDEDVRRSKDPFAAADAQAKCALGQLGQGSAGAAQTAFLAVALFALLGRRRKPR